MVHHNTNYFCLISGISPLKVIHLQIIRFSQHNISIKASLAWQINIPQMLLCLPTTYILSDMCANLVLLYKETARLVGAQVGQCIQTWLVISKCVCVWVSCANSNYPLAMVLHTTFTCVHVEGNSSGRHALRKVTTIYRALIQLYTDWYSKVWCMSAYIDNLLVCR